MSIIDDTYEKALKVLELCIHPKGMKASAYIGGYPQVWARDSMITFLGASLIKNDRFQECFYNSLKTLADNQSDLGGIPTNVDTRYELSSKGAGSIDNNLWFLMGSRVYQLAYQDSSLIKEYSQVIQKALLWLRYQDYNECGLLEAHEAKDWADLLANRYHTLYANTLYVGAQRAAGHILNDLGLQKEGNECFESADNTSKLINLRLWISEDVEAQLKSLKNTTVNPMDFRLFQGLAISRPYYLPWAAFRQWGDYCDGFGNCLAILLNIPDKTKADSITGHMFSSGMDLPYPIRVTDPPITNGSKDWREYYRNGNLNQPNQYHNGGIWPFVGGFYVASLVANENIAEAEENLQKLAQANYQGKEPWEFNEWLHGVSGRAMGAAKQAWSAGMYIYAYHAVKEKQVKFFPF